MKKMKRFLVAMLGCLTAVACLAGVSACKKDKEEAVVEQKPSYDININMPSEDVEKCVHDYSVVYAEEAATCDKEGSKTLGCSKCGEAITVSTGLGHDFGDASCTAPATCNICGEKKDMLKAAHTWVAATCTANGYCSVCKETNNDDLKKGHTTVAATCATDSYCSVCNENFGGKHELTSAFGSLIKKGPYAKDNMAVDANGYYYIAPANCATQGYAAFSYCATCLEKATDEKANLAWALFNNVEEKRTDAEKAAYLFETGKVRTEGYQVLKMEHKMVNFYGTAEQVKAGTAYVEAKALNKAMDYVEATCDTGAVQNFQACATCLKTAEFDKKNATDLKTLKATFVGDKAIVSTFVEGEALGHDYGDTYVAGLNATCVAKGFTESWECVREGCNAEKKSTEIAMLDHDGEVDGKFVAEKATNKNSKAATCTTGDYCGNCKTEWTKPLGHNENEFVDVVKATCTTDGFTKDSWYCDKCGYVEYVYDYATGHKFNSASKVSADTLDDVDCTTNAYAEHYACANKCGAVAIADEKDKNNNVVSYKVVDLEDLIIEDGEMTGHSFVVEVDGEPKFMDGDDLIDYLEEAIEDSEKSCEKFTIKCEGCGYEPVLDHNDDGVWYLDQFGYPVAKKDAYVVNGEVSVYNVGIKEATCTTKGECDLCGDDFIDAIGHKFIANTETDKDNFVAARPATCEDEGMRAYYICANGCGAVATVEGKTQAVAIDKNGNKVDLTVKNYDDYLEIKAVGHAWAEIKAVEATCTTIGWNKHIACADCGDKATIDDGFDAKLIYKEVKATDHKSSAEGSCATEIVCDKGGENGKGCGETFKNPNVQPDNHKWNATEGECDCCKVACKHNYSDGVCTICKKSENPLPLQ